MREFAVIGGFSRHEFDEDLINRLTSLYPEGLSATGSWVLDLPYEDPRVSAVMELLASLGLAPWTQIFRERQRGTEYRYWVRRDYDESDFRDCQLLRLLGRSWVFCSPNRVDGCLRIYIPMKGETRYAFRRKADLQFGGDGHDFALLASDRVKRLLEAQRFRDLCFRPTFVVPPRAKHSDDNEHLTLPWDSFGDPWWELTSDLVLPRMSERAFLRDARGRRITDDFSNGCFLKEALEGLDAANSAMEPKYRAAEIDALGEFDVAQTFEWFGQKAPYLGRLTIVSNRFYRWCREHKLKVGFTPVRVQT